VKIFIQYLNFELKKTFSHWFFMMLMVLIGCKDSSELKVVDNFDFAKIHQQDLQLSVYITAHTVERLLSLESGRREAVSLMRANGITKVYIEVYRGGLIVSNDLLEMTSNYFKQNGFEVVGGIATTPGPDFGVKQKGQLTWFNWQNPKTQEDLRNIILGAAPFFDSFIVDDFLLTADVSEESIKAKGNRTWSEYRRQLLTEIATSVFINPARSVNPTIEMIIKFPQSYDVFHTFGYDVETGPELYDRVWVGTESRGQYTQRFGFVQPYEGFVNYRWMASLAGTKIGAAWFDHGDCDKLDFIEQAYQSVLAGAKELVIFNYGSFINGHQGHHLLRMDFEKLAALAKTVNSNPVYGIPSYKPPHSDAGGDLYMMDFVGMFGIPLIPVSSYPIEAQNIFLPTQAATDTQIVSKIEASLEKGTRIIMTSGFLATIKGGEQLIMESGITRPKIQPQSADKIIVDGNVEMMNRPLDLEAKFEVINAKIVLEAIVNDKKLPFLTKSESGQIYVLNSHTFSQADFDAVGEVLLCPRQLGLLDLPVSWANSIRNTFNSNLDFTLVAPTRVSMQPLRNGDIVIHNYRQESAQIILSGKDFTHFYDAFNKGQLKITNNNLVIDMKPRSRIWLQKKEILKH
jgi:hypothetical protein